MNAPSADSSGKNENSPVQPTAKPGGDIISGTVGEHSKNVAIGKGIRQITYAQIMPPPLDAETLASAQARLAQLPVDTVPAIAPLPPGSRMQLGANSLFVGRETELQRLAAALKGGETISVGQIAATTGLGGIGKTQLAVAFVHHYGHYFMGGVHWLSFADPDGIPAEIAACGLTMPDLRADFANLDLESQVRLVLAAWQSPLPRLLIFDNCEEPGLLAQWRPPTGGSRVLITSRRQHWDAALGVNTLTLPTLPRRQSIALLHKFPATQNAPPFTPQDETALHAIARELGDLPLALHLAGAYLARYRHEITPAHYLTQLQKPDLLRHRSLQAGDLSPTGHEQHVERTFALSYARLGPADGLARALLARAACFAPGQLIPRRLLLASIQLDAIELENEDGAHQTADALRQLANLGLVEVDAAGDILLHRLVAHFVNRLDAAQTQAAHSAVAAALLQAANRINNAGLPGPLVAWQAHLRHMTDIVQRQANAQAADLCNTLGFHLKMIGDLAAAQPYYARALKIRETVLGTDHPDTAGSYNNLGSLLHASGDLAAAKPYYERALAIREAVLGKEHPATATSYNNLGGLLRDSGDLAAAKPYLARALAICEAVLGTEHPNTRIVRNNLTWLQRQDS